MRTRGPILTLLAMVLLAIGMLAANMTAHPTLTPQAAAPPVTNAAVDAAPAAPPLPATGAFNGKTTGRKGGEATVAITIRDGLARAYVHDGKKLQSWLEGRPAGAAMTLRSSGGNELTGELRDGKVTGTASINGARWPYSATPGPAAAIPNPPGGWPAGGAR